MDPYSSSSRNNASTSYGSQPVLHSNPSSTHSSPRTFAHDLDQSSAYNGHPPHPQTYPNPLNDLWPSSLHQTHGQQRRSQSFMSHQNPSSYSGSYYPVPSTPSLQVTTATHGTEHDPNEHTARPGNAHLHAQFHHALSLPLPPMPDSGTSLVTPTATTGSSSISSMSSAGLTSVTGFSSASSVASNFVDSQQQHMQRTEEQRQAALDSGSDYITGTPGLSKGLSRPLTQLEKERLAYLDRLKYFLATAPSRWHSTDPEQGGTAAAGSTPFAPNVNVYPGMSLDGSFSHTSQNAPSHPQLNRFMLPSQEFVTCVLWNGLYHITGTDIVRALVFRFEAFGRPVRNMKKFEEGVFSDLRNLKPGVDACLEEPKSPFLDLLFKYQCIRTQKKQKVFYWFSVPHDRLFLDALDRDLKREKMAQEPTTVVAAEPAMSFSYDAKRPLYEQFSKMLGARDGESEYDRNVRLAVKGSRRGADSATDGEDSSMDGGGTADESDMASDADDDRRPGTSSSANGMTGARIFGQIQLPGSKLYKHRKRNITSSKRGLRQESEVPSEESRGRGDIPGSSGCRYGSTSASRERMSIAVPRYTSMMDEFGPGSADDRQHNEPALSAADFFLKQAKGELLPADGIARKPRVDHPIGEVGVYYSEGAPLPPSSASSTSSEFSAHSLNGAVPTLSRATFPHSRNRSVDLPPSSSHPHRHSYHGNSTQTFETVPTPALQSALKPGQPTPVSSTAMYEQHGPDGKIKAFVCPLFSCGRLFKRMEHLKRHLRTHTMERPFACNKCDKKFSRSDNLNQHLRTHDRTGSVPASSQDGTAGDGYASGNGNGEYMEDDSEHDEERRKNRSGDYGSEGESDEEVLIARYNNPDAGYYPNSLGLHQDLVSFNASGGYGHDFPMRELEARDVHEVQGDEEGLLVVSPGGSFNPQYYSQPADLFSAATDNQWSSRPVQGSAFSFASSSNPLNMRGNRNSVGSVPGNYVSGLQGHSTTSSGSSMHNEELSSLSAPSSKAGFDHTMMYPPGVMLDDTSGSGGPIRRHRSMTPSFTRSGEPIRRPTTSNSNEFNPGPPGSTPSSVGSSSGIPPHRGYHPYAAYSSSRGGSAQSSPALHNIPLGSGTGEYTQMRSRNSSFTATGPPMHLMGTDVSMAPPDAAFAGDALYRTNSPAMITQTESPSPYTVDLPGQYNGPPYYNPQGHSATMPVQFSGSNQFGEGYYPQHVSTL